MRHGIKLALTALAFLATGCSTYSLEELRQTTPSGTPFQNALSKHYMEYASEAEKDYDWPNSWHFADKGLMAAYGNDVGPEDLNDWDIPEEKLPDLQAARQQLMLALTPDAIHSDPETAARAQFAFDCWVKEQEQNWREDHIGYCRDQFQEALKQLTSAEPSAQAQEPEHPAKKSAKAAAAPAEKKSEKKSVKAQVEKHARGETEAYIVFFQGQDAELTASGKEVVDEVVSQLSHMEHYEVVLHSHTDTKGSAEDDLKLSEARAQAVKQRLVDGGVKADAIKSFAFGKSDTPVKTADNVAEPANHRVEIFLNGGK